MATLENMTIEFPATNNTTGHWVHRKDGDKNTIIEDNCNVCAETAMEKYLSERLNSVSKGERMQGKINGDNDRYKHDNAQMITIETTDTMTMILMMYIQLQMINSLQMLQNKYHCVTDTNKTNVHSG
eukprot:2901631-Ditylum_brightwellii.AAC.1